MLHHVHTDVVGPSSTRDQGSIPEGAIPDLITKGDYKLTYATAILEMHGIVGP